MGTGEGDKWINDEDMGRAGLRISISRGEGGVGERGQHYTP